MYKKAAHVQLELFKPGSNYRYVVEKPSRYSFHSQCVA